MSENPLNLLLRFVLELLALAAFAYWGWVTHTGVFQPIWAVGAVVTAATVWGVFRVPGDGHRGDPRVPVPGGIRLMVEASFFTGASTALIGAGQTTLGIAFAVVIAIHYALSYDRVAWLLKAKLPPEG